MLNTQTFNSFMNNTDEDFNYPSSTLSSIIEQVELQEDLIEEVFDLDCITVDEYA